MKTTTTKHTPGPWKVTAQHEIVGPDGKEICWGYREDFGTLIEPITPANARLIAEAPTMYSVISAILYHDERGQGIGYAEVMKAARQLKNRIDSNRA